MANSKDMDRWLREDPEALILEKAALESPLEETMLGALRAAKRHLACPMVIRPQAWIGRYRVDFALEFHGGPTVVVECDGMQWHHDRPGRIEDDYRRERALAFAGCVVTRFTSWEIMRNAQKCAAQAVRIGLAWARISPERAIKTQEGTR